MKMPSISYAYPKLIPWQNLIIGTSVWKKDSDDINIYYQFDSYRYVSGAPSVVLCCIWNVLKQVQCIETDHEVNWRANTIPVAMLGLKKTPFAFWSSTWEAPGFGIGKSQAFGIYKSISMQFQFNSLIAGLDPSRSSIAIGRLAGDPACAGACLGIWKWDRGLCMSCMKTNISKGTGAASLVDLRPLVKSCRQWEGQLCFRFIGAVTSELVMTLGVLAQVCLKQDDFRSYVLQIFWIRSSKQIDHKAFWECLGKVYLSDPEKIRYLFWPGSQLLVRNWNRLQTRMRKFLGISIIDV